MSEEPGNDARSPRLQRILFACDPAGLNERARGYAIDLARRYEATLILLLAAEVPEDRLTLFRQRLLPPEQLEAEVSEARQKLRPELDELARVLSESGVRVHAVVTADERIGEAILGTAKRLDADLILMGSRGHGKVVSLLVGSISDYVLHNTDRPVLFVPDQTRACDEAEVKRADPEG
jgi:nucleotide-binding universal stress UspA family protein